MPILAASGVTPAKPQNMPIHNVIKPSRHDAVGP